MLIKVPTRRTNTKNNKRRTNPQEEVHLFSHSPNQRELGSTEPCAHVGSTQPTAPASGQDAVCWATQRYVRLTRGSMTKTSPWSSRIEEGTLPGARRRTMNSTEFPKLKLTMSFGEFCGPNKGSLSLCQRMCEPGAAYWFRFTPVGTSFLPHQGDKKGATLPHKPITPSQMSLLVCGLTAAPCP